MSGRPVRLLAAATIAAAASLFAISGASAGCYSCGTSYSYAPVATYTAPVVYSYSYQAPAAYAAPAASCGCGYASYGYAASGYAAAPMYAVNQGPAYTEETINAEPTPSYDYGYSRSYPYYGDYGYRRSYPLYGDSGARWHRRHWGYRYGYRPFGYRGYRSFGYRQRFGVGFSGPRFAMRPPMVGPRGFHGAPRFHRAHFGMHRAHFGQRPMGMMHRGPMPIHRGPMGAPRNWTR